MDLKQKFIILRKMKYAESDLIIHALSPQGAKVSFLARGALKSKKRFGGGILEPTHFVQLSYKPAKEEGQLNILNEASLIQDFAGIRKSYEQLDLALHVIECIYKVSQEGDQDSEGLYNLLGHTLKVIDKIDSESPLAQLAKEVNESYNSVNSSEHEIKNSIENRNEKIFLPIPKLKLHFYLKFLLQQGVLTVEPWMAPFLKTPLAESESIEYPQQDGMTQLALMERSIRYYLESAAVSH